MAHGTPVVVVFGAQKRHLMDKSSTLEDSSKIDEQHSRFPGSDQIKSFNTKNYC